MDKKKIRPLFDHFWNSLTTIMQHSQSFHTMICQLCGDEKGLNFSLLLPYTTIFGACVTSTIRCNSMNASMKRLCENVWPVRTTKNAFGFRCGQTTSHTIYNSISNIFTRRSHIHFGSVVLSKIITIHCKCKCKTSKVNPVNEALNLCAELFCALHQKDGACWKALHETFCV